MEGPAVLIGVGLVIASTTKLDFNLYEVSSLLISED